MPAKSRPGDPGGIKKDWAKELAEERMSEAKTPEEVEESRAYYEWVITHGVEKKRKWLKWVKAKEKLNQS